MNETQTPDPATRDEIVRTFLAIPVMHRVMFNWGTAMEREDRKAWDIEGTDTYINGVILTIDFDYMMGYLIECVDQTSQVVSYHVIVVYPGPAFDHDSVMYEPEVGTFFERKVHHEEASEWAVGQIYGLVEGWYS